MGGFEKVKNKKLIPCLKYIRGYYFMKKKKLDLERSEMQGKENVLYKLLL